MQPNLWTGFYDPKFPPIRQTSCESSLYDLLVANRFADARDRVRLLPADSDVRRLIEAGRYQDAVCALGSYSSVTSTADFARRVREASGVRAPAPKRRRRAKR